MKSIQRILAVLTLSAGVLALSNCATSGGSCSSGACSSCEAGAAKKCAVCGKAGCTACEAKMKH